MDSRDDELPTPSAPEVDDDDDGRERAASIEDLGLPMPVLPAGVALDLLATGELTVVGRLYASTNNALLCLATRRCDPDPDLVAAWGFKGEVVLKARYTFEQNRVSNWSIDNLTPYIPTGDANELTGGGRSLFLAYQNPNYTAQIVALSLGLRW